MVAPNGAVYSETAVCKIAAQNNGMFKNPESGMTSHPCCKTEERQCCSSKQALLLQASCARWTR